MANQDAVKILKENLGVKLRAFPRDITIAYDDSKLTMTLLPKAVGLGKVML